MSRFFEYHGDCGKKSLLKTRLLRNIENGASASGEKKKRCEEKPRQQSLSASAPVLSRQVQHHTPGHISGG